MRGGFILVARPAGKQEKTRRSGGSAARPGAGRDVHSREIVVIHPSRGYTRLQQSMPACLAAAPRGAALRELLPTLPIVIRCSGKPAFALFSALPPWA